MAKAPKGFSSFSTLNKDQKKILDFLAKNPLQSSPLYGQGVNNLLQLLSGSPEATANFEAPFLRAFKEQTIPAIAERFSGLGAQSSSAFQQALGQAGAGLQEQLASLRSNLQTQALPLALQFAQAPLDQQRGLLDINTLGFVPKQQGFLKSLLESLAPGIGSGAGAAIGNSFLPGLGNGVSALSRLFSSNIGSPPSSLSAPSSLGFFSLGGF